MTDQETIILVVGIAFAFIAMMAIQWKAWKLFTFVMIMAIIYYAIVAFSDEQEPTEPNQTILEQLREKWRDKEGEPVDGSRD
jgi:hypothetical protein